MKPMTRVYLLDDNGERFFGEGPCRLLLEVEKAGSLRGAAAAMNMAYSKALKLLGRAEAAVGVPLTLRSTGGRAGGGSCLTSEGRELLERYMDYREQCQTANTAIYHQVFGLPPEAPPLGCVIMASGLGRRFGGNKLMAEFLGKPLIEWVLDATGGIFARRVVVTRHEDVAALCQRRGVSVLLHSLPHRSDTVRLGIAGMAGMAGCLFCPGDQPLLSRQSVLALARSAAQDRDAIWRLAWEGEGGTPVLFPGWAFQELEQLPQGRGGNALAQKYPQRVRLLPAGDEYELADIDTPGDLARLEALCRARQK